MPRHVKPRRRALRLKCPVNGAYSNLEYDGLYKALHQGFAEGTISLDNYSLCLLSGAIGARPIQLASLRICDLKISSTASGKSYVIAIPRAKQRGAGYRKLFTERPLIEDVGIILEAQVRLVRVKAYACGMSGPEQAPMFPASHAASTFFGDGTVLAQPTSATISQRIGYVMEGLGVKSERTGKPINVHATRARRTTGTRAAQAGRSLEEIAAILDHSSLNAAKSYIQYCVDLLQSIDRKLAMLLAPMAQRFAGKLATRGNNSNQEIQRHVFGASHEGEGPVDVGGCGKHGFCGLGKPVACYTCRLFHPWLDGPHEAILEGLLARRRRIAEDGSPIVAATLDDTIVACAEVVRQCLAKGLPFQEQSVG